MIFYHIDKKKSSPTLQKTASDVKQKKTKKVIEFRQSGIISVFNKEDRSLRESSYRIDNILQKNGVKDAV